jgi:hypothetical protein
VAVKLIYQLFAKLLSWMVLHSAPAAIHDPQHSWIYIARRGKCRSASSGSA